MVTAPTVIDPRQWDYEYEDQEEMIFKQNALNEYRYNFSVQLAAMCDELNIEFQFVAETRIDITNKSGQVAADRQAVTQAKASVDQSKTHIDQQKQAIDTTAGQVSDHAQQVADDRQLVADDKQAAADSAQAAGESAGQAEQSKQAAQDLYQDLDAVNTAKTQSQQAAQTATEQAGLADTARQEAQTAAQTAGAGIDDHVGEEDPHTQYVKKTDGDIRYAPHFEGGFTLKAASQVGYAAASATGRFAHLRGGSAGEYLTYPQAVAAAAALGVRLPTVEELEAGVAKGSGGGYDATQCWTCSPVPGQPGYVYTCQGDGTLGTRQVKATDDTAVSNCRFVANVDVPEIDAASLNGLEPEFQDVPDTIVRRDSLGDIKARLLRSTYPSTNSDIAAFFTTRVIGGDYLRPSTPGQVRDALGVSPTTISGTTSNNISGVTHTHNVATTASRDSTNTSLLLNARGMYDHKRSGDHDGRYYTKSEVDSTVNQGVVVSAGAVGSYGTFYVPNGTPLGRGTIVSGSTLTWAGLGGAPSPDVPSGSWRLMSHSLPSSDADRGNKTGLFQRVSE